MPPHHWILALADDVRDVGAGGSNPLSPTNFLKKTCNIIVVASARQPRPHFYPYLIRTRPAPTGKERVAAESLGRAERALGENIDRRHSRSGGSGANSS